MQTNCGEERAMDFPAEKEICAICGMERLIFHRNLQKVKTKFSSTPVFQLLERFSERELSYLTIEMVESGACNACYAKLNEYDAAYTKALIIQQELTDLLQNSTLAIFEETSHESEQEKAAKKSRKDAIDWVPQPQELSGEMKPYTNKQPTYSIAGLPSMRVSMQCNVCGEIFNNINSMKLHSHDEANEQEQTEDQMATTKEPPVPSPMLVIEDVKTEAASVENSDDEVNVYLEYPNGELYPKEEPESDEYYLWDGKEEADTSEASHQSQKRPALIECLYCEAKFEDKLCLRAHFKTHHPQNDEDNVCKVCGFATRTRAALASHYGKHLRESELTCEVCSKKFTQRASLQRHMAIHTGEKPYQCDVCGKRYIHYSSFYMHGLAHKNVRSKNCTICGYTLRSNSHLIRHMRTHSGEKPYACPVCGQKFSQRYNMVQHQKTHSGVMRRSGKTFKCLHCDYTTARNALLKTHLWKHHGKDINSLNENDSIEQMRQQDGIAST